MNYLNEWGNRSSRDYRTDIALNINTYREESNYLIYNIRGGMPKWARKSIQIINEVLSSLSIAEEVLESRSEKEKDLSFAELRRTCKLNYKDLVKAVRTLDEYRASVDFTGDWDPSDLIIALNNLISSIKGGKLNESRALRRSRTRFLSESVKYNHRPRDARTSYALEVNTHAEDAIYWLNRIDRGGRRHDKAQEAIWVIAENANGFNGACDEFLDNYTDPEDREAAWDYLIEISKTSYRELANAAKVLKQFRGSAEDDGLWDPSDLINATVNLANTIKKYRSIKY